MITLLEFMFLCSVALNIVFGLFIFNKHFRVWVKAQIREEE